MTDAWIGRDGRELQRHGTEEFPCACYHTQGTGFPWHWHDEMELIQVTQGALTLAAGSGRYAARQGDVLLINALVPHALLPEQGVSYEERDVVFHPRLIAGGEDTALWSRYVAPFLQCASAAGVFFRRADPRNAALLRQVDALFEEFDPAQPCYEFAVREALTQVFVQAWREICSQAPGEREDRPHTSARVRAALDFIDSACSRPMTLGDIAAVMHVSPRECQRAFRSCLGASPHQCLQRARLSRAAELLTGTEESVTEICFQCGFRDCSSFASQFRRSYGMTPLKYRRATRNGICPPAGKSVVD